MGLREDIVKRIEKRQQELAERQTAFALERVAAQAYIQAMQDVLKSLPKDSAESRNAEYVLRPGSAMAQARDAIRQAGRPLHLNEILRAIGRPVSPASRTSIGGSIANYVRRNEVFIRTAPNTFGLIEMTAITVVDAPPADFGRVRPVTTTIPEIPDEDELVL